MARAEKRLPFTIGDYQITHNFMGDEEFMEFSKHAYESFPRSKKLRDLCLVITTNMARFLWDESLTFEEQNVLEEQSRKAGEQLVELGIYPNIHVDRKPRTFLRKGPIMLAEFVAGQMLPESGYVPRSEQSMKPIVEEFNQAEDGNLAIIETEQAPTPYIGFIADGWMVANAMRVLDAAEEVHSWLPYKEGFFKGQPQGII